MLETRAIDNVEDRRYRLRRAGRHNDLCMEMGIPGQLDHPRVARRSNGSSGCQAHGKCAWLAA
jgi:hypothetical protein